MTCGGGRALGGGAAGRLRPAGHGSRVKGEADERAAARALAVERAAYFR